MNSKWAMFLFQNRPCLNQGIRHFSRIGFKSREQRDEVNAKIHKNPRLAGFLYENHAF
jgi:uncharacterized protein YbaA (DUF1428 family)